jgi:hypothetical protein
MIHPSLSERSVERPHFGSSGLRLPAELRGPLLGHLADLKKKYLQLNWAGRVAQLQEELRRVERECDILKKSVGHS